MVYLVSGLPLAVVAFALAVAGVALGAVLLPLAPLGVPVLALALVGCSRLVAVERARAALLLGFTFRRHASVPRTGPWAGRRGRAWGQAVLADPARWRQVAGISLALPVSVAGCCASLAVWALSVGLLALPAYGPALPGGAAHVSGWALEGASLAGAVATGALLLLAAPRVTLASARLALEVDRALLAPSREEDLAARVGELEASRSRMVVAASSDRRRIERDLHDGAQARLVCLAMELGRARARFDEDPAGARALVGQAHEEAKAALAELRSLVRGVHPPVLSDRGLDAALPGLASLCPVPVTVQVGMSGRASPTVEAVAYFIAAEALANVAKHSRARSATVTVRSDGTTLWLAVRDDGRGGARPDGPGLQGLADRARAVDGRLRVTSPLGGPTVVEAELPCGP
jgi:signal transduction histidine kinase